MSLIYSKRMFSDSENVANLSIILPATAAILNLVTITALNFVYDYLAVYLTDLEYRRTQTEYDESLTLKIYLFQFVNYYSSIFYIAYLKGKFVGYPKKYNRIFGFRQEECSPGGCLMELCIQLIIIMVGKQLLNAILEMLIPFLYKSYYSLRNKMYKTDESDGSSPLISCNQWTNDFKLMAWSPRGLFDDYLEMSKRTSCFYLMNFPCHDFLFSHSIRLRYAFCRCLPTSSTLRLNKQCVRNEIRCQKVPEILSTTSSYSR